MKIKVEYLHFGFSTRCSLGDMFKLIQKLLIQSNNGIETADYKCAYVLTETVFVVTRHLILFLFPLLCIHYIIQ